LLEEQVDKLWDAFSKVIPLYFLLALGGIATDELAAAATAQRNRATAVLYEPIVMRDKETTASFKIYFASSMESR
jgi:hypothetical protein